MGTIRHFSIQTLGCKLNFAESSSLSKQLRDVGWQESGADGIADLYILNTCSVTEFADRKCRKAVKRYKRTNPQAKVIVTGCYAQLQADELAAIPGVDLVLGASEKFELLDYLEGLFLGQELNKVARKPIKTDHEFVAACSTDDRTRAFLKVQDGCDYKCSFCTIPKARGQSRSAQKDAVLRQIEELAKEGVQEVVLTGVNIGDYGTGLDSEVKFIDLLSAIDVQAAIPRIRISSIEPNLCTDEIISFVAQSKTIMPHFHMPLQSGSNRLLKLMRRRYKRELYADRVAKMKSLIPQVCIGVDVIVGFPGEADQDFEETYQFINEMDISYLHVFTFSARPDTPAIEMENQIPLDVRRQRNERLRMLSEKKKHYFYKAQIGKSLDVLFESKIEHIDGLDFIGGYTDNYVRILKAFDASLINTITKVDVAGNYDGHALVPAVIGHARFISN